MHVLVNRTGQDGDGWGSAAMMAGAGVGVSVGVGATAMAMAGTRTTGAHTTYAWVLKRMSERIASMTSMLHALVTELNAPTTDSDGGGGGDGGGSGGGRGSGCGGGGGGIGGGGHSDGGCGAHSRTVALVDRGLLLGDGDIQVL